jgi:ABC-2 type transport system permease protein
MKTMKWLIKREMWENKGMLFWTPVVIATTVALLAVVSIFLGKNGHFQVDGQTIGTVTIEGMMRTRIAETMAQAYIAAGMPVLMVLGLLVFFYCLNALHDERRDRSLLFWKSLPVSDFTTVMSKLLLAVVVAPLITIGIAVVLGLVIMLAACVMLAMHGTNMFGAILSQPDFYLTPLRLVGLLPVYVLWALPTVGWLLMVSSMARSKVFLWAVGTPVIASLLLLWAEKVLQFGFDAGWIASHITNRILLGVVPGSWLIFSKDTVAIEHEEHKMALPDAIFNASWSTLGGTSVWIGAVAGVAMIAVAVYMRRHREEV